MIRRIERAARAACASGCSCPRAPTTAPARRAALHHPALLDAGVRILGYPKMLHAKAFVRDGEEVLAGTCNLEAWSLKRFFEIDVRVRSRDVARSSTSASRPGRGGVDAGRRAGRVGPRFASRAARGDLTSTVRTNRRRCR
jgi:hypothetical protein